MRTIETDADIAEGLKDLARADPRLGPVIDAAGRVPMRRRAAGFPGLARIVFGQQVSVASANAIAARFEAAFPECTAEMVLRADDQSLRACGLSAAKIRTLRAIAETCRSGLDLDHLGALPGSVAHETLTAITGIGPWTADVYLLFCLGHRDVFPAGDLALRQAVGRAFGRDQPVPVAELARIAETWSPWRGVAALLFWAYFWAVMKRTAMPV